MRLRTRLLMRSCLAVGLAGLGLTGTASLSLAQQAPVPLFMQNRPAPADQNTAPDTIILTPPPVQSDTPPDFSSNPDAVQALSLGAIDSESTGIIDSSRSGLNIDMWQGINRALAIRLVDGLPATTPSPTAHNLAARLLQTIATAPAGNNTDDNLLAARVNRLIVMGELDAAAALVAATPQNNRPEDLARAEVNALLLAGQDDAACAAINGYSGGFRDVFWLKASVFCQLRSTDQSSAAFSIDLVREMEGESDRLFFALVAASRNNTSIDADLLTDPQPLDIAMLELAGQSLPVSNLDRDDAVSILGLVNSRNASADTRLEAARIAERKGFIGHTRLAEIYNAVAFDAAELDNALDATDGSIARQYAKLYQAANRTTAPTTRAETLAAFYDLARANDDFPQAARLTEPMLVDIPRSADFGWFAMDGLMTGLYSHKNELAAEWLRLARSSASSSNAIESQLLVLYPALVIAGLEDSGATRPSETIPTMSGNAVTGPTASGLGGAIVLTPPSTTGAPSSQAQALHRARMDAWWEQHQAREDQASARYDAALIFALFHDLGIEVPDKLWDAVLVAPFVSVNSSANPGLMRRLDLAARQGQTATAVALALIALHPVDQTQLDARTLSLAISALYMIGLEQDGRKIALETILDGRL
ncbi:antifreeze glycopeptide [Thalassospira sp.]|uniref:antifreeze glycopeptide n=1 Tax=Thalassospira sp. TaxID=1912094 RepID=UPI0027323FDD|nr:antifreeze glycopeptide [Thalassospira sp.]MDP2696579.1 antifreeze glycopeptide [Thalassospira sp.]